jgi:hypothetical protein
MKILLRRARNNGRDMGKRGIYKYVGRYRQREERERERERDWEREEIEREERERR